MALTALPPDCGTALGEAGASALQNGQPYLAVAHCVRDGVVQTYDILAPPTLSRWGGTLIGAYVNERGLQYNLLDAIYSTTAEGVLSLSSIRDSPGRPFDSHVVPPTQVPQRLLKLPPADMRWYRRT